MVLLVVRIARVMWMICDVADDARGEGVVGDDAVLVMVPLVLPLLRVV